MGPTVDKVGGQTQINIACKNRALETNCGITQQINKTKARKKCNG